MNANDRASFETFCVALQSFPRRLAERPDRHGTVVGKKDMNIMNGQKKGRVFMNTRRQNFWSLGHVGVFQHSGDIEDDGMDPAVVVVYRFQLRYADIPIEPVIEITEPLVSAAAASSPDIATKDSDVDVHRFNKRVADAVRAVLGGAGHGGMGGIVRAGRRQSGVGWRPTLW